MGYDDSGSRAKLVHMPLKLLLAGRGTRPWHQIGTKCRRRPVSGGCLADWPAPVTTGNGHRPFGPGRGMG
jgi:hypothetical protein